MMRIIKMVCHLLRMSLLLSLLNSASPSSPQIYGVKFDMKLKEVMDETLGLGEFQELIDSAATFNAIIPDGSTTIKTLTEQMGQEFNIYNKAVTSLRDVIERDLGNLPAEKSTECCKITTSLEFNSKYNNYVDRQDICFTVPSYGERNVTWNLDGFRMVARANERDLLNIGWQYFGTEEGWYFDYPKRRKPCHGYDPRMRFFYAETSVPVPKDIVIIFDYNKDSNSTLEAIKTLLMTTNPNDRIGMVTVPRTTPKGGCYSSSLALATPANYPTFVSFLSDIKGSSLVDHSGSYIEAFGKAFDYFTHTDSRESRRKLILFITDKSQSDSAQPAEILNYVKERNKDHDYSVVINTYAFGKNVNADTKKILKPLAERTFFETSKNVTKKGKFTDIMEESYDARNELGSYYNAFADSGQVTSPTVTVPYVDYFGLGLVISLCLPVHDKEDVLKGVTCLDALIHDIFRNVTYFNKNKSSYAFLIDSKGRAIIHPLLPKPSQVKHKSIFMDITALETEREVSTVIDSMKSGGEGSKSILASRQSVPSLNTGGDHPDRKIPLHYFWHPVPYSNYSLCLVMTSDEVETELVKLDNTQEPYLPPPEVRSCTHNGIPVYSGKAQLINEGNVHRDDKTKMESLTGRVSALWVKRKDYEPFIYYRHLVTTSGVIQIYPGTRLSINPFIKQWYTRALDEENKVIMTHITSSQGNSIMLSSALLTGKNSEHSHIPIGVMAGEYRPQYIYQLLLDTFPACQPDKARCFIIDGLGHVLLHPKTLNSTVKDHIVHIEPEIAANLKRNGHLTGVNCSDYERFEARHYWKISMDQRSYIHSESPLFEIHPVHFSNIYIGIAWMDGDAGLRDTQLPGNFWQCSSTETCNCPCETKLKFNYCGNAPDQITRETTPNCPIDAWAQPSGPELLARKEFLNVTSQCFPCSSFTSKTCRQAFGCDWCHPAADPGTNTLQCLPSHECKLFTPKESSESSMTLIAKIVIPIIVILSTVTIITIIVMCRRKRQQSPPKVRREIKFLNGDTPAGVTMGPTEDPAMRPPPSLPPGAHEAHEGHGGHENAGFEPSLYSAEYATIMEDGDKTMVAMNPVEPRPISCRCSFQVKNPEDQLIANSLKHHPPDGAINSVSQNEEVLEGATIVPNGGQHSLHPSQGDVVNHSERQGYQIPDSGNNDNAPPSESVPVMRDIAERVPTTRPLTICTSCSNDYLEPIVTPSVTSATGGHFWSNA